MSRGAKVAKLIAVVVLLVCLSGWWVSRFVGSPFVRGFNHPRLGMGLIDGKLVFLSLEAPGWTNGLTVGWEFPGPIYDAVGRAHGFLGFGYADFASADSGVVAIPLWFPIALAISYLIGTAEPARPKETRGPRGFEVVQSRPVLRHRSNDE